MKLAEKYLTINQFSRPGRSLIGVKGIVVHWVANPMTTAEQNRNYFESLKMQNPGGDQKALRWASAHFVIGLEGEVIQCLLENEIGYHVGANTYTPRALRELSEYPNNCTIGIELCHKNWEGEFTKETLQSAKELIRELCERYKLGRENIYRHYDITGKECPLYFVKHGDQWDQFLEFIFSES
jgi:N-acetylmuramoyl-L-alanine amidase